LRGLQNRQFFEGWLQAVLLLLKKVDAISQKSRVFHIHKSHIPDPQCLSRLLISACLAYIWIIYFDTLRKKEGWLTIIHRNDPVI